MERCFGGVKHHRGGMASSPNKVVFRPRAVDPTRKMPIRIFRTKVQSPGKIAASILPPSGMEKGEEKVKDLKKN